MPDKQQPAPAVIPTQDPAPSPPIPVTAVPIFDVTPVKLAPPVAPGGGVDNTGPAAVGAAGVTTGIGNGAGSGNGGAGAGNVTVIRADWAEMLSWADIHPFHPRAALAKGMSGEATITCQVRRNKRAYNCLVRSEQPVGHGFGAAAVAMTRLYRIHPRKVDGKAIDDGRVFFKVGFYVTIAEARAALGLKQ